jgi:hypothetical protein
MDAFCSWLIGSCQQRIVIIVGERVGFFFPFPDSSTLLSRLLISSLLILFSTPITLRTQSPSLSVTTSPKIPSHFLSPPHLRSVLFSVSLQCPPLIFSGLLSLPILLQLRSHRLSLLQQTPLSQLWRLLSITPHLPCFSLSLRTSSLLHSLSITSLRSEQPVTRVVSVQQERVPYPELLLPPQRSLCVLSVCSLQIIVSR